MKKCMWFATTCLVIALFAFGCTNPAEPPTESPTKGSISITISEIVSRNLTPSVDLVPALYSIEGAGPSGGGFTRDLAGSSSVTIDDLAAGDWTVRVVAENAAGALVGEGTASVALKAGAVAEAPVIVKPYDGFGTLSLALGWTSSDLASPAVAAELLSNSGDARNLAFVVDAALGTASWTASDIATGHYTVRITLKDGGSMKRAVVDSVLISKECATSGNYDFSDLDPAGGPVSVNIGGTTGPSLGVTVPGVASNQYVGSTQSLAASVPDYAGDVTFIWYVDGAGKAIGQEYSFGAGLGVRTHALSVRAYSADGTRMGLWSKDVSFTVAPVVGRQAMAGNNFSAFVLSDDTLWGTGSNRSGQIGLDAIVSVDKPTRIISGTAVDRISAGYEYMLILKTDGSLWGTGGNSHGQFGNGTGTSSRVPIEIMHEGISSFQAGSFFSLFIKTDGSLWASGNNDHGQLGDGTTTERLSAVKIMDQDVAAVSSGSSFSMILKTDGSLWAVGDNSYGQLGDGTATERHLPVRIIPGGVAAVACGSMHAMILMQDGSLRATGYNAYGQLGDGTKTNRSSPITVLSSGVASVSAGSLTTMIIKTDRSLWGAGSNSCGQFGNGTTTDSLTFIHLLDDVARVSTSNENSLVVRTDGSVYVCGSGGFGSLGLGYNKSYTTFTKLVF